MHPQGWQKQFLIILIKQNFYGKNTFSCFLKKSWMKTEYIVKFFNFIERQQLSFYEQKQLLSSGYNVLKRCLNPFFEKNVSKKTNPVHLLPRLST